MPPVRIWSGLDFALAHGIAAHHLPKTPALAGVQRLQTDDPEQLEEWFLCVVQPFEAAGGSGEQNDLGFCLQRPTKFPAEVVVHVFAQRVKVLDHQDESLAQTVRGVKDGGAGTLFKMISAPISDQFGMCIL